MIADATFEVIPKSGRPSSVVSFGREPNFQYLTCINVEGKAALPQSDRGANDVSKMRSEPCQCRAMRAKLNGKREDDNAGCERTSYRMTSRLPFTKLSGSTSCVDIGVV